MSSYINPHLCFQQTTPPSIFLQLDKSLREALTLDGVLEFRHEKFWALAVEDPSHRVSTATRHPSGYVLTGSLHVRIRRDANEQKVLAHVRERLSPLVPLLTVQVCTILFVSKFMMFLKYHIKVNPVRIHFSFAVRDDLIFWVPLFFVYIFLKDSSFQVFKDDWTRSSTTLQLLKDSARALATSPTHSPHYVNVTYPQVYSPLKPNTAKSPRTPQTYYPRLQESSFTLSQPQPSHGSLPRVEGSPRIPYSDFNNTSMDGSRYSHSHVRESLVPHERSESHMPRISGGWGRGVSGESTISTQTWMAPSDPYIPREGHSPKPSPHYVNVDFSAKSGILQNVAGKPIENCNSFHHVPR